jgi:hypothetical protein
MSNEGNLEAGTYIIELNVGIIDLKAINYPHDSDFAYEI